MAETEKKLLVKKESTPISSGFLEWHPFETLRHQIDKLFEDFPFRKGLSDFEPFERFATTWTGMPPVDLVEKDKEYEITAELPGLDDKNVEVELSNGTRTISGEKKEEMKEKERRSFRVPEGVDADKIEASFQKGILTVRLDFQKTPEAQLAEKKIAIKAK